MVIQSIFLGLIAASVSFAQIAAGLRGRVLDPSGAGVPNAHVELIESAKNVHQSTMASSTGDYVFSNLNPGWYEVVAAAPGFQTLHHAGITVAVGQTVTADLALSLGGYQQLVTISSDYPVMQAATSDIQTNISGSTSWAQNNFRTYRFVISLNNDNNAQGLSGTATFTWEADNT